MDLQRSDLTMEGDRTLLNGPRRAFLVSRTPRRPAPGTPWVRAVVEATRKSADLDETIVIGVGRDPYDLALRSIQNQHGRAIVVIDGLFDRNAWWRDLLPERHLLVQPSPLPTGNPTPRQRNDESRLRARDTLVAQLADRAWEISVRQGGIMAALARDLRERGCQVDGSFKVSETPKPKRTTPTRSSPSVESPSSTPKWTYLTHYTREPDGAWPGESRTAYLDWLADGPLDARRDAAAALERILEERCIRGSSRLMPHHEPMISWTAAPPHALAHLRRWRPSLNRWDFRPYGIAIHREVLAELGARPVRYLSSVDLKALSPAERLFAQKHEPPTTDWSTEMEWRTRGDLKLGDLPSDAVRLLLPTDDEARRFAGRFEYPTLAIGE